MDISQYLYHYSSEVVAVHDGDTCSLDIDCGFNIILRNRKIRLARINAPELNTAEGPPAREALNSLIGGKTVILETIRDRTEKYGRYLGEIWIDKVNINDQMLANGHAVPYTC